MKLLTWQNILLLFYLIELVSCKPARYVVDVKPKGSNTLNRVNSGYNPYGENEDVGADQNGGGFPSPDGPVVANGLHRYVSKVVTKLDNGGVNDNQGSIPNYGSGHRTAGFRSRYKTGYRSSYDRNYGSGYRGGYDTYYRPSYRSGY